LLKSQVELDDLAIAQGSLLLSFQSSMVDQNINSSLLATAIGYAKRANAHLYYSDPTFTKEERHQRKRLWWSCILRDRIIALGVRRPLQIPPDSFDFGQECLTEADFVNEIEKSQVYRAPTKHLLVEIVALQCQLAVAVTPLLMAMYPTRTPASPMVAPLSQFIQSMARIEESKTELAVWARRSRTYAPNRDPKGLLLQPDAQESVTLYADLTYIYYL
jgi:Fungal specific transcription factor domain